MYDAGMLRRIEWYGWGMTALLTLGAGVAGRPLVASGFAIGGALSVLHFKWLALFLTYVLAPQKVVYNRIKKIVVAAYLAKYFIICGVVYVLFKYSLVEPLAFLGGLSVVFVAICVTALHYSVQAVER
jgi:hypothetical protein